MPIVNDTNFVNKIPVAADYVPWVQDSDGEAFTATFQQLADLFASLAALNLTVTVISAQQTLTTQQLVVANSGSAFDLDLPASSLNTGRTYHIYNKGAGAVTITPNGSDTIGGAASLVLAQGESVIITSDGIGNWATFGAP
jgi:hypothetical protein